MIALFPWAKPINKEEEVTKVICKVYSKIHGKSLILVAKSDNLWKHQGAKTTKRLGHGVVIGEGGGNSYDIEVVRHVEDLLVVLYSLLQFFP